MIWESEVEGFYKYKTLKSAERMIRDAAAEEIHIDFIGWRYFWFPNKVNDACHVFTSYPVRLDSMQKWRSIFTQGEGIYS
jgi:hypothetical protein